jgi:precorrin-4/cobalt-precorrin-4 C11-methyltransferase
MIVSFIGAGPGDPELLTIKGCNRVKDADVIIYAGSLINPEILKYSKPSAEIHDSKNMVVSDIVELIIGEAKAGKKVVRLHTGDISLYSSLIEQIAPIEKAGIDIEIIPGISSFQASAACLKREFTIPGGTQTLILSRLGGRTPVPDSESLESLAKHNSSLVLFLSMSMFDKVVITLKEKLPADTPIAVCHKISWPEGFAIIGTLENIKEKVKGLDLSLTTLILVGKFIKGEICSSKLYDKNFTHKYRKGSK